MKITRIATIVTGSLLSLPSYIYCYTFIEKIDPEWPNGFVYERIINDQIVVVYSSRKSYEYNEIVSDARKALYQKNVKGIGQFFVIVKK